MNNRVRFKKMLIYFALLIVLGSLSSLSVEWLSGESVAQIYTDINLPPMSPPGWVFGPAWVFLYVVLSVYSATLNVSSVLGKVNTIQLVLNIVWTPIFFGLGLTWLALIVVIAMDVLTVILIVRDTQKIRLILYVYLAWLIFATYLTFGVLILN
ncbi:TspO/MBR family protein [Weissella viridescens]|uniref:TspO/MBR family protein n=1 Tax=Weissella viridescens TaxID=1629 RepID=UPI0022E28653|nr:TspO/MBR family protein [Weissella viridescens]